MTRKGDLSWGTNGDYQTTPKLSTLRQILTDLLFRQIL